LQANDRGRSNQEFLPPQLETCKALRQVGISRSLLHQFLKRPHPIRNTRRHGRGDAQGLVLAHEIIVREVKADSRPVVWERLRTFVDPLLWNVHNGCGYGDDQRRCTERALRGSRPARIDSDPDCGRHRRREQACFHPLRKRYKLIAGQGWRADQLRRATDLGLNSAQKVRNTG
jgi:hypothetical protein